MHFYIVDVFAEQSYAGNPLAVVVEANTLSSETMQRIAAEMNFSETTFVNPDAEKNNSYGVRIFTPTKEIDFAGHPILGTAMIVRDYVSNNSEKNVVLNLSVGPIPVTFEITSDEKEVAWFQAPSMMLGEQISPDAIAPTIGLLPEDIKQNSPVQVVSAGTSAILVPIQSLAALKRARLKLDVFKTLKSKGFPPLVYLFCNQTQDEKNDLNVRFFFEANGVREDPATGNGAAFLGAYLLEHKIYTEANVSLRIEQGHEIGRPSLIMLRAQMQNGERKVEVGGHVVPIVQGNLL